MSHLTTPPFVLLYVTSPAQSARFYEALLDSRPIEESPTFAMFALPGGSMLGLWAAHTVAPKATAAGGGELAFVAADRAEVDDTHARWQARGLPIEQRPQAMDFGYTFVALDPDGHRLRVFAPMPESST